MPPRNSATNVSRYSTSASNAYNNVSNRPKRPNSPYGQNGNGPLLDPAEDSHAVRRIQVWHLLLLAILAVFVVRAFYVQVVRYDYYRTTALNDQLKQYQIPASRGTISAYDGSQTVPIVMNQKLYTVYADPTYVKDPAKVAGTVAAVLGGKQSDYEDAMRSKGKRYVILAKKVAKDQEDKLLAYKYPGLGAQEQTYRTYPQGSLAGQILGFVNDEGQGTYGIEQALHSQLSGTPGELKAITDAQGVPLAANGSNIDTNPVAGKDVTLTLDIGIQKQVQQMIAKGVQADHALSGSAVVMDPNTGAIKAMANFPTYDPAQYSKVEDPALFNNAAVTHPIEIGSIMKTLTTSAALDQGVIQPTSTFYDPSFFIVDKFRITNIEEDGGPGTRNIAQLLNLSLNTGAVWELMQMGGGQINQKARDAWYDYMANHFMLGKSTGIEQTGEEPGLVPDPEENGAGIDLTYANTAFGQAMTATPVQVAGALSSVLNGGTYYKPHVVAETDTADGTKSVTQPVVEKQGVVKPAVGAAMVPLMQYVVDNHSIKPAFDQSRYVVGGKTGTAQVAKPNGGYYDDVFNGTYVGFVGSDKPQYVVVVFINRPVITTGYAGTAAAQPVFADIAHMLINNGYVAPRK
jgi:cell division protein FtsI/penicillin-binding protein 2